nr:hypothetical protein GTC16762_14110 [Pigmentibacter ruber]
MKKTITLLISLLVLSSCSKNEIHEKNNSIAPSSSTPPEAEQQKHAITYNTDCLNSYKKSNFKNDLESYIYQAMTAVIENKQTLKNEEIQLNFLSNRELFSFYKMTKKCMGTGPNILTLLNVETKDTIIRRIISDSANKNFYKTMFSSINEEFNFPDENPFYEFANLSGGKLKDLESSYIKTSATKPKAKAFDPNASNDDFRKLIVLHSGIEAHNVKIGGIATVLEGMIPAENKHKNIRGQNDIDAREITPFYDVVKSTQFNNIKYVGYIKHYIDGAFVISTIYKLIDKNNFIQYFVQPDPSYSGRDLFYVTNKSNIYKKFVDNNVLLYFSSAIASFSALYNGENTPENIDIVQVNTWHQTLVSSLFKRKLNKLREDAGLPKVGTIYTVHTLNGEQGEKDSSFLTRIGFGKPSTADTINLHVMALLESDAVNTVSKGIISEIKSSDDKISYKVGDIFTHLENIDRFFGIPNGIDPDLYNPRKYNVLGNFKVANDLSDLKEKKQLVKQTLYNAGIIGSPNKPLYLFVGRYSNDKGLDVLPEFVKYAIKNNAQVVIMGIVTDPSVDSVIKSLEGINDPNFKFYKNLEKDQLEILKIADAKKGNLIRFAADFSLIPSKVESFGLVALEALAMGSGIITTNVQGLKDITIPYDPSLNNIDTFNSVIFNRVDKNTYKTFSNMKESVTEFLKVWNFVPNSEKINYKKNWINGIEKFFWNYKGGSIDQYFDLYLKALTPYTQAQNDAHNLFIDNYNKFNYKNSL